MSDCRRPADLARKMAARRATQRQRTDTFRRETFALPREAARAKARELFARFPKAAYMTEIESWRTTVSNSPCGGCRARIKINTAFSMHSIYGAETSFG